MCKQIYVVVDAINVVCGEFVLMSGNDVAVVDNVVRSNKTMRARVYVLRCCFMLLSLWLLLMMLYVVIEQCEFVFMSGDDVVVVVVDVVCGNKTCEFVYMSVDKVAVVVFVVVVVEIVSTCVCT